MGLGMNLRNDEHSMIFSNHFSIKFQPVGQNSAPKNDWLQILSCTGQIASSLILAMLAFVLPWYLSALCCLCLGLILIVRIATLVVYGLTVVKGKYTKEFYMPAVFFWGWWPVWQLFFVVAATVAGALIGNYMWADNLMPYYKYSTLQMYKGLDPAVVPGERVQDAGLVDFSNFAEIDRSKGGCYMHSGNTYCVAPIAGAGEVRYGLKGAPQSGSYDYFAVGINCCTCPNKDFQCGAWNNPTASGGMRSLDYKSRPFYSLALDDWKASYGKSANHPMFFDWTASPEWKWKGMWNRALEVGWLAAALGLSVGLTVGFLLDKVLQLLWAKDIIVPRACFAPAPGLGSVTEVLMPKMFYRYQEEQAQIAAMPVSAEWIPERGPGDRETPKVPDSNAAFTPYGSMQPGYGSNYAMY